MMKTRHNARALAVVWLVASGCNCGTHAHDAEYRCASTDDCAPGFTCVNDVCRSTAVGDGGTGGGGGVGGNGGGGAGGGGGSTGGGTTQACATSQAPVKRVFITSATFTGNLGGIAGADQRCADAAADAGLPGTFRAWLGDSATAPAARFDTVGGGFSWALTNGSAIATGWSELTGGTLRAAIDRDEHQNVISAANDVWTNVKPDGTPSVLTPNKACGDWTTTQTTGGRSGREGSSSATDGQWTELPTAPACNTSRRLYCFEQKGPNEQLDPDAPTFPTQTDAERSSVIVSDIVPVSGITVPLEVSVSGPGKPEYRVCCTPDCAAMAPTDWSSARGFVTGGAYLQLRQTSSADYLTDVVATVKVGPLTSTWTVKTSPPVCGAGMVAWWKLDQSSGISVSDARGLNAGAAVNGITWQPMGGKFGGAGMLDGTTQGINVPDDSSLDFGTSPFAITGWFNGNAPVQEWEALFENASNSNAGMDTGVYFGVFGRLSDAGTDPEPFCQLGSAGTQYWSGGPNTMNLMDGQWHHLACVRDATNLQLYVDGVAQTPQAMPATASVSSGLPAGLGYVPNWEGGGHVAGLLDDVRVYRRAPGAAEIAAMLDGTDCVQATPPSPFGFSNPVDVALSTQVTSDISQVMGQGRPVDVVVAGEGGPQYRICAASDCSAVVVDWTSASVPIASGQWLQLRQTSSASYRTESVVTLTVGGLLGTWGVTTLQRPCGMGLVSKWKLDETAGLFAADAKGTNSASVMNGMWAPAGGKLGGALGFDGTSTRMDVVDNASLNFGTGAFTVSGWIRGDPQQPNHWTPLYEKMSGSNPDGSDWTGFMVWSFGAPPYSRPACDLRLNGTEYWAGPPEGGVNITDGTWHHLACVRDGGYLRMYLDGVQQGAIVVPGTDSFDTAVNASVGYSRQWSGNGFKGLIDDVRVYGRALSPGEVGDLVSGASCD